MISLDSHPTRVLAGSFLVLAWLAAAGPAAAERPRALFDNTHAETAGNADWQIDTDQPLPVPDQSTVTEATPRTYWLGAISSWAIDLVKRGYEVATLTAPFPISYGNPDNAFDLSRFDVFVVDEPNRRFSAAESTALFEYVRDGGGLVAIADHFNSDRDGDGIDSPRVWNALDPGHVWGVSFDVTGSGANFSDVYSTNRTPVVDDSIVHGPNGTSVGLEFHNGSSMTLDPDANPSVRGVVWRSGFPQGTAGVMAARAVYGSGRIFFVGDSSPTDDGSAAPGNSSIFDGWAEADGGDSVLILNGTQWATRRPPGIAGVPPDPPEITAEVAPNPARGPVRITLRVPAGSRGSADVIDLAGRRIRSLAKGSLAPGSHELEWDGRDGAGVRVPAGVYFARAYGPGFTARHKIVIVP